MKNIRDVLESEIIFDAQQHQDTTVLAELLGLLTDKQVFDSLWDRHQEYFKEVKSEPSKTNTTYFQLHDTENEEIMGIVKVTNQIDCEVKGISHINEINESWADFNRYEESDNDHQDVDAFVEWNNEGRVTQIERIFLDICQP